MPFKSDRRLYVDANDKVVEADSPDRAKLLVSAGGSLPMEDARRYGLVAEEPRQKPAEARTAPQEVDVPRGKAGASVKGQDRDPDDDRHGKKP